MSTPGRISPLPIDVLGDAAESLIGFGKVHGFVPNARLTMARVPGLSNAIQALGPAVFRNGLLSIELLTLIGLSSSVGAGCRYSQAHVAKLGSDADIPAEKLAAVWSFETSEEFSEAERAAIAIGFRAAQVPNAVTDADFERLSQHFTDDQIAAIVALVAFYGFQNRWNDTIATQLEDPPAAVAEEILSGVGWHPGKHR